ncbi:ABC transporter permease [Paenarthrobacter ureafaciens]|uniref:ABC transporter permease n=1 Tax=Paenarthrobacter ureafaciens TaxID=37931 RepID=UPI001C2C107E
MFAFITRRLASSLVILVVVCCLTYILLFFSGGTVAQNILGTDATQDQIAAKEAELGLNQPLLTRLGLWWVGALNGDFGKSWYNGEPVFEAILNRLPITLTMVIAATVLTVVISVILAVVSAVRRGWTDRAIQVVGVIGTALPNFLIGLFLVTFFAIQLGWFPAISTIYPGGGLSPWISSLTLPVLALTIGSITAMTQQLRSAIIQQLEMDYVRTLRSRGVRENVILYRHVLRSAAPPSLTLLGLQFVGMLGGVVIIEQMFALPGMGTLAVSATSTGDIPLVMGVVVYTIIIVIIVNLIVDLVNGWLNPKVRVS